MTRPRNGGKNYKDGGHGGQGTPKPLRKLRHGNPHPEGTKENVLKSLDPSTKHNPEKITHKEKFK